MLSLSVDSAADTGSIALADENGVREEVLIHAPQGFSRVLFDEIGKLLHRQGVALDAVDLFAAASGPGSFTGVRVGLSAIKGLAEVQRKPALAVSNLEALAELGKTDLRAPVIDAHRGEVYASLRDRTLHPLIPEVVLPFPKFLELLRGRGIDPQTVEWISQGCAELTSFRVIEAPLAIAGIIAHVAARRFAEGQVSDPAAIEANYVRRSDAELLWKDK
jgi:tRNA threonylcarbamoyladenosine biosynthesis protein TsaB